MKKKLLFIATSVFIAISTSIIAFAESNTPAAKFSFKDTFAALINCPPAFAAAVVSVVCIISFFMLKKKLKAKLDNSTASQMINAFIIFFSAFGLCCFALGIATHGITWSDMMHKNTELNIPHSQFSDYYNSMRNAATNHFIDSCDTITPFGMLIYYFLAQFVPPKYVGGRDYVRYRYLLKSQTGILMYLFIAILCIVIIYRMSRSVLRRNKLNIRDEITAFLLITSYPTIYCLELGNITALSLALVMFFILFRDSHDKTNRRLALAAIAVSGAIAPYTLVFTLLLFIDKQKKAIPPFAAVFAGFAVLFIAPGFITGFGSVLRYVTNFISMPSTEFIIGNTSISNLLVFFGISNKVILYTVFIFTEIVAAISFFILPKSWQKAAAAVYIMLNLPAVSGDVMFIFIFIPFIFLLAQKEHKAIDWLYLLSFSLIITPFPEWYYFYKSQFIILLEQFKLPYIEAANNLISLTAIQMIFALLFYQMIVTLKCSKESKKVVEQENPSICP